MLLRIPFWWLIYKMNDLIKTDEGSNASQLIAIRATGGAPERYSEISSLELMRYMVHSRIG